MGTPTATGRKRRFALIALIALVMLLCAEGFVRVRASAIPPPLKWATPDMDRKVDQMRELQDRDGASVVFLGSSTMDSAIAPSTMRLAGSRPGYNASVRGGTIAMTTTWAKEVVVPTLRPDVVVLGVASRELNENDARQRTRERTFYAAPAVRHLLGTETALQTSERYLERASALFRFRTHIRETKYFKALLGLQEAPSVTDLGFGDYIGPDGQFLLFMNRPYNPAVFLKEEPQGLRLGTEQQRSFRELLEFLSSQVDDVVVVNVPVTKDYIAKQTPASRTAFEQVLAQETKRAKATYLDVGIWPAEYFADPVHVNAKGSKRLTTILERAVEGL